MSNATMTDILSVTNVKGKNDFCIESCGEYNDQLNGYFVVLRSDKITDLIDYVIATFGDSYSQMLKDILSSNDEEDISSSVKTFSPDVEKTYTDLYLEEFGTPSRIKSFVDQENLILGINGVEEVLEEEHLENREIPLADEDLMLSEDIIKPENPTSPNPDLENEIRLLETKLSDAEAINLLLTKSNDELNSKIHRITEDLASIKSRYESSSIPDFAIDSILSTVNDVASTATKDALIMIIQTLTSTEENYILSRLIQGLVENYVTLGAIKVDQFEQEK